MSQIDPPSKSEWATAKTLQELIKQWEARALRKFVHAENYPEEPLDKRLSGARFIAHGGINIVNCVQELKAILKSLPPSFLTTEKGDQK